MNDTLFNFECFALLSIETHEDDEYESERPFLRGFWRTREEAHNAVLSFETKRAAEHEKYEEQFMYRTRAELPKVNYFIVPLNRVDCSDMCDLEEKIQAAASLQAEGIGVVAPSEVKEVA